MRQKIISLLAAILIFLAGWALAWETDRIILQGRPTPTPVQIYERL